MEMTQEAKNIIRMILSQDEANRALAAKAMEGNQDLAEEVYAVFNTTDSGFFFNIRLPLTWKRLKCELCKYCTFSRIEGKPRHPENYLYSCGYEPGIYMTREMLSPCIRFEDMKPFF